MSMEILLMTIGRVEFNMELIWIVLGVILVSVFLAISYIKAPPDIAYIISGFKKGKDKNSGARIIVGRATIRIPFFERIDKLRLNLMQVDIKTNSAVPTSEYINIFIDGVANIKVASDKDSILRAAENFLGRRQEEIGIVAQQVLEGNMREIVGQMKLSDLVQNRDLFAAKVLENAADDMRRMGLEIINLTIQNFVDKEGIIQDLGIDNIARIRKDAAIAKANAEKDIAVAQATAMEESNKAKALADINIALQNKEVEIKKSEFKIDQDVKKAEADAAYAIQEQEQRKSIETSSVNADIARREREVELKEKEIALTEKSLDAEVKKKAEAEKYAIEQQAQADKYKREQAAMAAKIEQEQQAEADKIKASAKRFADEEEAKGIEAKGRAEAEAILAKAEAMKAMGEASVLEMYLQVLPEIVKNASIPLAQTDKIIMYGDGNSTKLIKDVMSSANQITEGIAESTGIDVKSLLSGFIGGKAASDLNLGRQSTSTPSEPTQPGDNN